MLTRKSELIIKALIKAGLLDKDKEEEAYDISHEQMFWGEGVHPIEHGDYCIQVEYYKTTKEGKLARDDRGLMMRTDAGWRRRSAKKHKKRYTGAVLKKPLTGARH